MFVQGVRVELGVVMARFWLDVRIFFKMTEGNQCRFNVFAKKNQPCPRIFLPEATVWHLKDVGCLNLGSKIATS